MVIAVIVAVSETAVEGDERGVMSAGKLTVLGFFGLDSGGEGNDGEMAED